MNTSHEREKLTDVQKRRARYYNSNAQDLPVLSEGDTVRMKPFMLGQKEWKKGVIVERLDERSYEVETADGSSYRRNRVHLKRTNETPPGLTISSSYKPRNEPPPELTIVEPPEPSVDPDKTDDSTHQEKSNGTEEAPYNESCKEAFEPHHGETTGTRSGRTVKRPAYLNDYVT